MGVDVHPQSERLLGEISAEFPQFRLVHKSQSPLSRLIDQLLRLVTLGRQRAYLTRYHTVIGYVLYLPACWERLADVERVILLRHERVHLRQRRRLGMAVMAFVYLVPWFPLGLAYGRARLEWEAYCETLRATHELLGREALHSERLKEQIVSRFVGADYGWMWPFRGHVEAWYQEMLDTLDPTGGARH
jgi:hypothetical protein